MPGYPDFQAYAQWRGAPFIAQQAGGLGPGGNAYGTFNISHYSGLTLHCTATNRPVLLQVAFGLDNPVTQIVEIMQWNIPVGGSVTVNVPALAPYVAITVTNFGAAGGTIQLYAQPTNITGAVPSYISQAGTQGLGFNSQSLATTAGFSFATSEIFAGPVTIAAGTSSGTSFHGSVSFWDGNTASFITFAGFSGSVIGQRGTIQIAAPPCILQVSLTNDDAATRTCYAGVFRAG